MANETIKNDEELDSSLEQVENERLLQKQLNRAHRAYLLYVQSEDCLSFSEYAWLFYNIPKNKTLEWQGFEVGHDAEHPVRGD